MRGGTWLVAALLVAGSWGQAVAQTPAPAQQPGQEPAPGGAPRQTGVAVPEQDAPVADGNGAETNGNGREENEDPVTQAEIDAAPADARPQTDAAAEAAQPPETGVPETGVAAEEPAGPAQGNGAAGDGMQRPLVIVPSPDEPGAPVVPAPGPTEGPLATWRQLVAAETDVARRAEQAALQLAAAEVALAQGDSVEAVGALQVASQTLQGLHQALPGSALATQLGEAAGRLQAPEPQVVDLRQLVADVESLQPVLPPQVTTLVADAQRQLDAGEPAAAGHALLGARNWLVADLDLLAAEQAYARARAALAEAQAGNLPLALDLVQGVPEAIAALRNDAPLAPVRLRLRAAAQAAQMRNWVEAEQILNEAAAELRAIRQQATPALARRIDGLTFRVSQLQEQLAAGRQPTPQGIRAVARAAGGVQAG